MNYEPQSLTELGNSGILKYWPKLLATTYHKTSEVDPIYNCVTWINSIKNHRIDYSEDEEGNPVLDPYFLTSYPYIEYFEGHGFDICSNGELEENFEKICIYVEAPIKLTTSGRGKLTTCFAGEDFQFRYVSG